MFVYFLRHASAGQRRLGASAREDEKRALDKDGLEQCRYLGRALAALGVELDVIITSPLKRAEQTAALVGSELGHTGQLVTEDALRPEAGFEDFQEMTKKYARREAIMVVGHNPNLSEFLSRVICDGGCEAAIELKKGAIAKVEMRRNAGSLSWCITPRILRTLYTAATENSRPKISRK
jgi:phosphohistidine phosphatase